ncbi:NEL-type E3 ubiquitin ligase domain-containing protein [Pseudomonas sp. dw_358]|uniref:NEL-type E3 ubiquitin ligase domain-containing protein n=1 Tax=Pseudomonas sp. dw_358 TaxID=2720083 RepID=UPI001BD6849C|nr:NEL-type E3 ubiquitin ligase domain-containing protein [Pseudomonas sp. dw_358]
MTLHPTTLFVAERLPNWVKALDRDTLATLGDTLLLEQSVGSDLWFTSASDTQRQTLLTRQARRAACRRTVSALIPSFKTVMAFTEGLLQARIKERFNLELDVHANSLVYVRGSASFAGLMQQYQPVEQSLLLAALHNFTEGQTFDANAGLVAANGYDIENVTPEQLRLAPQNYGDFQLDFIELQPQSNPYPLFRFKPQARLPIKPAEFATLCRELDLGRLYQDYLTATFAPGAVTAALVELRKAEFATLCQVALLKGDIDAAAFVLLERCHDGEALTCADKPMKAVRMSVLGAELHDVVLFVPIDNHSTEPCIAWIPGDSQVPLKRYANSGAFMRDLLGRLDDAAYLTEFLGRINLNMRVPISERLAKRLLDTHPNLAVDTQPCEMPLFDHLQRRHRLWLLSQGQCQAIPTARVDQLDTLDRWEGYLDSGIDLLNLAAMFIPVLGPTLMSVMAAQTMNELYHGLADLAEGDKAAGWSHLTGIALNLGLMGAVHGVVWASNNVAAFTDNVLRAEGPDGVTRLWNADITPYAADLAVDTGWQPNASGLYALGGVEYLPLDGEFYPTRLDALTGERLIVRPAAPGSLEPMLRGSARSGWLHQGEEPLAWDRYKLLRRAEPQAWVLEEADLDQALRIADVEEPILRAMVTCQAAVPVALTDTLQRFAAAREIDRVIEALGAGQPVTSVYRLPVERVTELPGWPADRMLKVFEGPELWGEFKLYGMPATAAGEPVTMSRHDFVHADRIEKLLLTLGDEDASRLAGGAASDVTRQAAGVRTQLAEHLRAVRRDLFEEVYHLQPPAPDRLPLQAGEAVIGRDFPGLEQAQRRELLEGATFEELKRLNAGRVPLRMGEAARALLREKRISRAMAGLYQPALSNADTEVLKAAWGNNPSISALDRDQAAELLGIRRRRGAFQRPVRVGRRVGYPASGRGRLPATHRARMQALYPSLEAPQIDALMAEVGVSESLLQEWLLARESELAEWLPRLETWRTETGDERQAYHRGEVTSALEQAWRRGSPPVVTADGQAVGHELNLDGLDLRSMPPLPADFASVKRISMNRTLLSEPPDALLRRCPQLRHLFITETPLTALPETLTELPALTRLRLNNNGLVWTDQAQGILDLMPTLMELNLSYNPLGRAPEVSRLLRLRGAILPRCQLSEYPLSVLGLPMLETVDLRGNQLTEVPEQVLAPGTDTLDRVQRINRGTLLADNPLGPEALRRIRVYSQLRGNAFGWPEAWSAAGPVGRTGLQRWVAGMPKEAAGSLVEKWQALATEPQCEAFFDVIEGLKDSAEYRGIGYAGLRERVRKVIEAAYEHTALREELFNQAGHPRTCGDGASYLFSTLEVSTLVHEARVDGSGEASEGPLLKLAKGLFRLDEVQKIAYADIAARTDDMIPDQVEVILRYRTALADALDLPGQPKEMRFEALAGVSDASIAQAQADVFALDDSEQMVASIAARDFWVDNTRRLKIFKDAFAQIDERLHKRLEVASADAASGAISEATFIKRSASLNKERDREIHKLVMQHTRDALKQEVEMTEL